MSLVLFRRGRFSRLTARSAQRVGVLLAARYRLLRHAQEAVESRREPAHARGVAPFDGERQQANDKGLTIQPRTPATCRAASHVDRRSRISARGLKVSCPSTDGHWDVSVKAVPTDTRHARFHRRCVHLQRSGRDPGGRENLINIDAIPIARCWTGNGSLTGIRYGLNDAGTFARADERRSLKNHRIVLK
jgi:hypothetical protein